MTAVPAALADVTTSWLSAALAPRHGPVAAFTLERIGEDFGFASEIARVRPTYLAPAAGPASVVVKLAAGTREACFYRDVGDYAGVRVPHAHFATVDEDAGRTALVLEDIGRARFGDDLAGLDSADTGAVVDALASLHARWWESPRLAGFDWLRELGATVGQRLAEFPERFAVLLERHGDLVPDDVRRLSARIGPQSAGVFERLAGPPATMLHVDSHADNVAFLDGEPVLFDWQGVARGAGTVDIAHFLASALRGADRAAEPALFARWVYGLAVAGVDADPVALRGAYRAASLRWWIGVVGGLGSPAAAAWAGRQAEVARASVPRWVGVVTELQLGELL